MKRTLAIIPARAGSKRIPGKNTRLFMGKPLIQWTMEFARSYSGFDEVVVSTDCDQVMQVAEACGLSVPWRRPAELATDHASTVDVVLHALGACDAQGAYFDRVAVLQATTPFRRSVRWDRAHELLNAGVPAAVGVCRVDHHPYWTYWLDESGKMEPCFPEGAKLRSQDLPAAGAINGALYWCTTDSLRATHGFTPEGVHAVCFDDPLESIDIDTERDWVLGERMLREARVLL
jgi:CMP-N-acetylneuraminic acid synthetase